MRKKKLLLFSGPWLHSCLTDLVDRHLSIWPRLVVIPRVVIFLAHLEFLKGYPLFKNINKERCLAIIVRLCEAGPALFDASIPYYSVWRAEWKKKIWPWGSVCSSWQGNRHHLPSLHKRRHMYTTTKHAYHSNQWPCYRTRRNHKRLHHLYAR